ncbi:hypothetical protein JCM19037_1524 [Geomicrobium sp. JCM 19037]|uniref:DUF4064 domain-containing protein n=1 Tax=unclassified Geomicrobium TaxID=2628951 RepID=UPI00045F3C41|nr:DUF4064 domain-containing protein [Geomicrobium sp. JCM 19037]GAK03221.1 hypothetical protein JCM19037_1524 [Geomicrobium sp. JCM 19037]
MKRTGEKVLGWIGVAVNFLVIVLTAMGTVVMSAAFGSDQLQAELEADLANDPALNSEDIDMMLSVFSMFSAIGWFAVVVMVIGMILAIIGLIKINGNAKTAGILLIVSGALMVILTLGGSIIQSVLFIIAGIMCLARKPQVEPAEEETSTDY